MPDGPCILCGTRNYALSMGGPTICPACDAGNFHDRTAATKRMLGLRPAPTYDERSACHMPTLLGRCTKPKGHPEGECADMAVRPIVGEPVCATCGIPAGLHVDEGGHAFAEQKPA